MQVEETQHLITFRITKRAIAVDEVNCMSDQSCGVWLGSGDSVPKLDQSPQAASIMLRGAGSLEIS